MPITPQEALQRTIEHREIFEDEMFDLMRQVMRGDVSPQMTAAIMIGLRVKKETVGEITGAARAMRELARRVDVADRTHLVDIVGTGGDGANTFNISTASSFVIAAAGGRVAKHGGRSVSSTSGSADAYESLGAAIELPPEAVAESIARTGIGFMYAPAYHPAMKVVAPVRREMGVRTLFNILGPLTNPADAPSILMGVFHPDLVGIQVRVLQELGAERALVVWGRDGMDEISLGAGTLVGELRDGRVREYELHPEDFGIPMAASRNLKVEGALESKAMVLQAITDADGLPGHIVALNAGAALYVAGVADSIASGVELARATIASGAARAKLDAFVATTRELGEAAIAAVAAPTVEPPAGAATAAITPGRPAGAATAAITPGRPVGAATAAITPAADAGARE
ncbi:anthranilate phosphoribosyltransferase [Luteimonas sp. MC1782]|nr:anthranilate phosphoribosyltransferase [Luteimonas sp. MC1895]